MSNYKTVFFIIGVLQIILGIFMTIPILLQLVLGELDSSFITSTVITLVFGVLFVLSNLDYNKKIKDIVKHHAKLASKAKLDAKVCSPLEVKLVKKKLKLRFNRRIFNSKSNN